MTDAALPLLDPRERHVRIVDPGSGLTLFLRHLPPATAAPGRAPVALYVHGATFPSALSVAHRFGSSRESRSWRDALCAAGFHVWALDFLSYGGSDRHRDAGPGAVGRVDAATGQLMAALGHIRERHGDALVSVIAHSWGTIPALRAAGERPEWIDRLVLFGPIVRRDPPSGTGRAAVPLQPWRLVTVEQQRERFVADVPAGEAPVLDPAEFAAWGEAYLDSDPGSRDRDPPAVRIPAGPTVDIARTWSGEWLCDAARVRAPVAVLRGEWDSLTTDADAARLLAALTGAASRHDLRLPRGTHLMHLESGRVALHAASIASLTADIPQARSAISSTR